VKSTQIVFFKWLGIIVQKVIFALREAEPIDNSPLLPEKLKFNRIDMKSILSTTLLLFISLQMLAWGQTGHRAVGMIATNHLEKKTKKELFKIMGHESLMEASTWMDNIKSDDQWDFARDWHYVTIPDGENYQSAEKNENGDAYKAINRMKAVVMSDSSSRDEKRNAIRMLVHLIGDIHQPLHVGNGTDRGGNEVKIKWFYDNSNLHRIWDSEMIDSKKLSYSELAQMADHPHEKQIADLDNTDVNVWIQEAMALRPQVYNFPNEEYLSYEYMYHNWDTVKQQLEKAGRRLAAVLNEILQA